MFTFLVIMTTVVFIALLLTAGVTLRHSLYSMPELERRARHSATGKAEMAREKLLPDIQALLNTKSAVLLVLTAVMLIIIFRWVSGVPLAIVVAVLYARLARIRLVAKASNRLYERLEPKILTLVGKFPGVFAFLREEITHDSREVHSKDEFQELIERSGTALTDMERKVIINAIDFNDKPVSSIMTPKSAVDFIKKDEFLGPLVLDELHALGHSRLPVIDKDLDHVVGILYLRDLLSLDIKRSATAEKAMDTHVYYIRKDQTLEHALAVFLKNRHHMLIVINKQRETVGVLTIEDTIEALFGRKIIDEDDNHADRRSVAAHEG